MSITEKSLITLEFDKIRTLLADCCQTSGAKVLAKNLAPVTDADKVRELLTRTTDAKRLYDDKGLPPFGHVIDIGDVCERAVKGAVLTTRELLDTAGVLRSARLLLDYIHANKRFDTVLDEVFSRLLPNRHLEEAIFRAIISEELIADEASSALADIRRKIRAANSRIKETLSKYISGSYSKYLQENIVTMRNGRYVIPVRAECKNDIKGLIHDTSSSGATIFVEPMAVVEANNELRMLTSKEEHEIERILAEFSSEVAGISPTLSLNYRNITELAFYFGCAEFSSRVGGIEPSVNTKNKIVLKKARHPLIDKKTVVPISVSLGDGYDTLVITGPNTGGKTVTLKTLGLFSIMAQSGLHIPADEGSEIAVFDKILVDLGDEQSIEQSLSTFSSHMVNIVEIVKSKNSRSLVLFDELGAGTDPVEGAALAVAVIEDVRASGALCAATTHYAELKAYALDTEGVLNASCEFDVTTLRPTYRLIIGTPGKSNAFAISSRLGLPETIIERANEYVSSENKNFESVIGQLEATRLEMDKKLAALNAERAEFDRMRRESESEIRKNLDTSRKELERSKEKASAIVESAKLSSDFILSQMDKVRKAKDTERLGAELDAARREIREHMRANEHKYNPVEVRKNDENYVLPRPLMKGDEVLIVSLDKVAVVQETPDKSGKVLVQAGIIKTKVALNDLRLIENTPQFIDKSSGKKKATSTFGTSVDRSFKYELDLRGLNTDEAWAKVDKYFDEAIMSGFATVRLVHGKGTGALKAGLWKLLRTDKRIKSFRIGEFGEGDGGVTVVELK